MPGAGPHGNCGYKWQSLKANQSKWLWRTTHEWERSWVRIPAPYTGWTWHFFTFNCCKRPKINEKEAGVDTFFWKRNNFQVPTSSRFGRTRRPFFRRKSSRNFSPPDARQQSRVNLWAPWSCKKYWTLSQSYRDSTMVNLRAHCTVTRR